MKRIFIATPDKDEVEWLSDELKYSGKIIRAIDTLDFFIPQWESVDSNAFILMESIDPSDEELYKVIQKARIDKPATSIIFVYSRDEDEFIQKLLDEKIICISYMDLIPGMVAEKLYGVSSYESHPNNELTSGSISSEEIKNNDLDEKDEVGFENFEKDVIDEHESITGVVGTVIEVQQSNEANGDPTRNFKKQLSEKSAVLFSKIEEKKQLILEAKKANEKKKHGQSYDVDPLEFFLEPVKPPKVIVLEKFIGSVIVAVGGSSRRSGTTYTAIQVARYLTDQGKKVALIELQRLSPSTLSYYGTENKIDNGFINEKIHCYPCADAKTLDSVYMNEYEYIVIDFGWLIDTTKKENDLSDDIREFARANIHLITMGSSIWDYEHALQTLDRLLIRNWKQKTSFIVNYATSEIYKDIVNSLEKGERKELNIQFYRNDLISNPFQKSATIWGDILGTTNKSKKKKFGFF